MVYRSTKHRVQFVFGGFSKCFDCEIQFPTFAEPGDDNYFSLFVIEAGKW